MEIWLLVIFFFLTLVAEVLGTIGGFGSSVFFVPMALYFFDFYTVLGITAVFHLASNMSKITMFRSGLNWRLIFLIGIPSVIFVLIGSWLTKKIDAKWLETSLNVFLILLSIVFLIRSNFVLKASVMNAISGGVVSGFLAGLVGTGGAIRGMTMIAFNLEKEIFIATSAAIDMGIDFSRTGVYFFNGYIHQHDLYLVPFLFGISMAGTYLGKIILKKIPQAKFKLIVLLLILGIGLFNLFNLLN